MYITKKDKAFYTFENEALYNILGIKQSDNYMTEAQIKDLMTRMSASYKLSPPAIKYTRKNCNNCYYRPLDHTIYYNQLFGCTLVFVLHEMCHAICGKLYPNHKESHGPEFVTVWIDVMSRYFDVDQNDFKRFANIKGIRYV